MENLKKGDLIGIPCSVDDGPFDDELVVQFETLEGPVSGFARSSNVRKTKEGNWVLKGEVISFDEKTITVMVEGSFFSTNGLADFAADAQFEKMAA